MEAHRDGRDRLTLADVTLDDFSLMALGDVLVLGDGRSYTVRSIVRLGGRVGSMAGFLLLGELDSLLSVPPSSGRPAIMYMPVRDASEWLRRSAVACEGVSRYWAPHVPALGGAMGEVLFKVLAPWGRPEPLVAVWRGNELVVFAPSSHVWPNQVEVLRMRRDVANEVRVSRATAVVSPAFDPVSPAPKPAREVTRVSPAGRL